MDCVFCKILSGEYQGSFVYRDEIVSVFLDRSPVNRGHVLVIPNSHHERFADIPSEVTGHMFKVAQKITVGIQKSELSSEGFNIFLSDGEVAGQEVPHSHLHIAPRFKGDAHKMGFSHHDSVESEREKLEITAKIISSNL